jgi:hypothetical protein
MFAVRSMLNRSISLLPSKVVGRVIMISRNLRIALFVSIGMHVMALSSVEIITPEDFRPVRRYTRVDFLGPILKKTAFDIMLGNVNPIVRTTYRYTFLVPENGYLKALVPKREIKVREFPEHLENNMDMLVMGFLTGKKSVPGLRMDLEDLYLEEEGRELVKTLATRERKVIYRPEEPFIMRGLYGDREKYRIKVRLLISAGGNIKKMEPVTTTGFPEVDIIVSKFVKGWIFEPIADAAEEDEWREIKVILKVGE